MKKTTLRTVIISVTAVVIAGAAALTIGTCINNNNQKPTAPSVVVSTEKPDSSKLSDGNKIKDAKKATQAPTAAPTVKPTQKTTQATTQKATVKPTQKPTQAPTQKPTAKPVQKPAQKTTPKPAAKPAPKPVQKPTQAPTVAPTQAPTAAPTQAPTTAPTEAPTFAFAEAPTTAPTEAATEAATVAATEAPTTAPTEKETELYKAFKKVVKDSKAEGYRIVKLDSENNNVLVLSFGKKAADRSYRFYSIGKNDLTLLGKLDAANSTAYTDKDTKCFRLFTVTENAYSTASVKADKGTVKLSAIDSGVIEAGQAAPKLPGAAVNFTAVSDLSGINGFNK